MEYTLRNKSFFYTLLNAVLFLVLSTLLIFIANNLNKGFELSDESYYVLATQYPHNSEALNSLFGLVNYKYTFGFNSLLALRIFKLIYQVLALFAFATSFVNWLRFKFGVNIREQILMVLACVTAGLINYDYLPMGLSYNSWSLNFALLFWALLFQVIQNKSRPAQILFGLGIGFILFQVAYIKTPNFIILSGIYLYVLLFILKNNKLVPIVSLIGGAFLAMLFLFGSPVLCYHKTIQLYHNLTAVKHTSFSAYVQDFIFLINYFSISQVLTFAGLCVTMYLWRKRKINTRPVWFIIAINAILSLKYFKGNSSFITNDFVFGFSLICNTLLILILVVDKTNVKSNYKMVCFNLLLLLSPLGLALGTSNPIFYTSSHYLVFLIAAVFYTHFSLSNKYVYSFTYLYGLLIAVFTCGAIYQGMYLNPYRQSTLKNKNLELMFSGEAMGIKEDSLRYNLLINLSDKLKKCNIKNLPVLASPPCLGAISLANMKPASVVWLADNEKDLAVNEAFLSVFNTQKIAPFLLISEKIFKSEAQYKVFKKGGIDFKNNYVLKDSIYLEENKEHFYFLNRPE